jgi:hypothetical protein
MGEDDIGFHEPASGFDIILIEFLSGEQYLDMFIPPLSCSFFP